MSSCRRIGHLASDFAARTGVGTRTVLVAAVALAAHAFGIADAQPARTPCVGRFAIAPPLPQVVGDTTPVIEIAASGVVTLPACGTTTGRLRAKRRATTVTARWTSCADLGRVTVTAKIASPACARLDGVVKRPKQKRVRFAADRIACGDGVLHPGEACDDSAPDGGVACEGRCESCACVASTTSSTITTTTTITDVPTSTTTSTTTVLSTSTVTTTLPGGPPIVAPAGTWTWVEFPETQCDDGSPAGIGVNFVDSPNLVIVLGYGGVCWDATTCWVEHTAVHGPFDGTDFANAVPFFAGTIFDRNLAGNPFADWNIAVAPYCTGDLHAGDNVVLYDTGESQHLHRHVGHANLRAFLDRLGPTFPTPDKVTLAGTSAGGFGALTGLPAVRSRWPTAQLYVLDDSWPVLEASAFSGGFVASWFTNWRLDLVVDPLCGSPCRDDLSLFVPALAGAYPDVRIGLVSALQDGTIADIFGLTGAEVEEALLAMAADRFAPTANARHFFVAGPGHVFTLTDPDVSVGGVGLLDWITRLVTDDPSWASIQP